MVSKARTGLTWFCVVCTFRIIQIIRSHFIATTAELKIPTIELSPEQENGTPIENLPLFILTGPLSHQEILGTPISWPSGGSLMDTHPETLSCQRVLCALLFRRSIVRYGQVKNSR